MLTLYYAFIFFDSAAIFAAIFAADTLALYFARAMMLFASFSPPLPLLHAAFSPPLDIVTLHAALHMLLLHLRVA